MPIEDEIDDFLASYPAEVTELAQAARRLLNELLPEAEETLDRTARVIGFGYGPGYKGCVCTLILSQKGVKIGVGHGAELPNPKGLLRGSGKVHRHVVLQSLADLEQPGLKPLIKACWRRGRSGREGMADETACEFARQACPNLRASITSTTKCIANATLCDPP